MSLQALANNMAAQGRGPDSMLVHMAPREVAGLQSLAMAHGGSLTINPATGLPEAGFLSNLLPTLIGGALTVASGGALSPLMAGLITGAGYGVASGSLSKGLMAGLGAFGGAGLGAGLSAAGAAEAAVPGAATVAPEATTAFTTEPSAYAKFAPTETVGGAFGEAPLHTPSPLGADALATTTPAPTYAPAYGTETAKNAFQTQAADASITDNFKQAGKGLTSLFDSQAGRDAFLGNAAKEGVEATGVGGLGGLAKYGTAALAMPLMTPPKTAPYKSDSEQYKYSYDLNRNPDPQGSYTGAPTGERQWFAPKFTRLYAEGGQTDASEDARKYLGADLTGASKQAYDYLMGNGPGYRPQIQTQSSLPAARVLTNESTGGGGGGPGTGTGGGITTLPTVTSMTPVTDSSDGTFNTGTTTPAETEQPVAPSAPAVPSQPSIYTDPIVSDIPDELDPSTIPQITPTTPLELPDLTTVQTPADKSFIDENVGEEVGPSKGLQKNQPELDEEFDQYLASDVAPKAVESTPDGGAVVTMPDNTVTAQDDGTTQVILDAGAQAPAAQQSTVESTPEGGAVITTTPANEAPAAQQSTVEATPEGGATVTFADQTNVNPAVADTFSPDTNTYVEVGNAAGDQGDRGDYGGVTMGTPSFSTAGGADYIGGGGADDFGKYGLGVSEFGGGNRYFEDFDTMSAYARGGMAVPYATGGISDLGGYSDGGRLLKGPGDGVSDSIPAMIGKKQPARLADGEFVIPARIVSELGNGSTDAGARKLYQMMDRIQAARKKTVGKNRVAVNSRADKMMPV